MSSPLVSVHRLRNVSTEEFVRALERDGFALARRSKSSSRAYEHEDGRKVFVHYHRASDTFARGTLANMIESAGWTEEDAKRLKLI